MACATVVGDNTQQRPGLRGTPARAEEGKGGEHPVIRDYQVYDYPSTRLIDKSGKFFSVAPPEDAEQLKSLIEQALANRQ